MKRNWVSRWRRKRLMSDLENDRLDVVNGVYRYLSQTRHLSYIAADYQARKQYRLLTKSRNLQELTEKIDIVFECIHSETYSVDHVLSNFNTTERRSLDGWLINDNGEPYSEQEAWDVVYGKVSDVINILTELMDSNPQLYRYFSNTSIISYLIDALEVIDTLVCLTLGVPQNERRHIRNIITR